jgi:hypothetical protein
MFTIRNYSSDESSDLGKLLNFLDDCYDCINSPFLNQFKNLPVYKSYNVNNGYRNLDQISQDFYGNPFYTFYIMYYNDLLTEVLPENTVLNMFNLDDFNSLYQRLSNGVIT